MLFSTCNLNNMHMQHPDKVIGFLVPGRPVGKQRARVTERGTYTPAPTKTYQNRVKWLFLKAAKGHAPDPAYAVEMFVTVRIVPPTKWAKQKRTDAKGGKIIPAVKPDIDNIAKSVMDALNGLAYPDDSCVFSLQIRKEYGPADEVTIGLRYFKADVTEKPAAFEPAKFGELKIELEKV